MEIKAFTRYLRMSPRKVRLVIDVVRGLEIVKAEEQLLLMKKDAALPVLKLLRSAKANAEHNFKVVSDRLYIKKITADGGPVFKRWTPKAFGRATPLRHRTTHLSIVLEELSEKSVVKSKKGKKTETNK